MTMGADPIACAALAGGADVKAFFVRKETKTHGLARRIEGPLLPPGDRCLLVEDVVTTGGSTIRALEAIREEGHEVCGVLAICDRLAGGAEAIRAAAGEGVPYAALTTIDERLPGAPRPLSPRLQAPAPVPGWFGSVARQGRREPAAARETDPGQRAGRRRSPNGSADGDADDGPGAGGHPRTESSSDTAGDRAGHELLPVIPHQAR